jgi:hypothetical protein
LHAVRWFGAASVCLLITRRREDFAILAVR